MTKDEALKMALEALNKLTDVFLDTEGNHGDYEQKALTQGNKTILAIKEALAQPEQEDDAVAALTEEGWMWDGDQWQRPAQPEQEPVAWGFKYYDGSIYDCISPEIHADCEGEYNVPLYTTPPKREWVRLTPADFEKLEQLYGHQVSNDFAFANIVCQIEATLKEKNTCTPPTTTERIITDSNGRKHITTERKLPSCPPCNNHCDQGRTCPANK